MASENPKYQTCFLEQLPALDRKEVERGLCPHYPLFGETVMPPWDDLRQSRATDRRFMDLTEDESAVWLTIQATHRARDLFTNTNKYRLVDLHRKLVIVVEERFAVTIKKLTRRLDRATGKMVLTRSNYKTPTNRDYWDQRKCGDLKELPRVILGYEFYREMTGIRLYIAYPRSRSRRVEWATRIPVQQSQPAQGTRRPTAPAEQDGRGFMIEERQDTARREEKGPGAG